MSKQIFILPSVFWDFIKIISSSVTADPTFSEAGIKESIRRRESAACWRISWMFFISFLPRGTYIQQLFILLHFLTLSLKCVCVCVCVCVYVSVYRHSGSCRHFRLSLNWGVGRLGFLSSIFSRSCCFFKCVNIAFYDTHIFCLLTNITSYTYFMYRCHATVVWSCKCPDFCIINVQSP